MECVKDAAVFTEQPGWLCSLVISLAPNVTGLLGVPGFRNLEDASPDSGHLPLLQRTGGRWREYSLGPACVASPLPVTELLWSGTVCLVLPALSGLSGSRAVGTQSSEATASHRDAWLPGTSRELPSCCPDARQQGRGTADD